MRPSRPASWGTVGSSTSRASWDAIPRRLAKGSRNWKGPRTWTPGVSAKKGGPETVDRDRSGPRARLLEGASGSYRRRSHASRGEVDELVAAADRQADG